MADAPDLKSVRGLYLCEGSTPSPGTTKPRKGTAITERHVMLNSDS